MLNTHKADALRELTGSHAYRRGLVDLFDEEGQPITAWTYPRYLMAKNSIAHVATRREGTKDD